MNTVRRITVLAAGLLLAVPVVAQVAPVAPVTSAAASVTDWG